MLSVTSSVVKKRLDPQQHSRNVVHSCEIQKAFNHDPSPYPHGTSGAMSRPPEALSNAYLSTNEKVDLPPDRDGISAANIEHEFLNSGYPLQGVRCQEIEATIVLSGFVCRYYYIQVALQLTQRLASGRPVVNHVKVIQPVHESGELFSP